jgi:hypothetical protein
VTREFDGKVLLITTRTDGRSETTTLKKVSTRRLGGREFLVGEYALPEKPADRYANWRGVNEWVPIEVVERIQVFNDLDQLYEVYHATHPPEAIAPAQDPRSSKRDAANRIPPTSIPASK